MRAQGRMRRAVLAATLILLGAAAGEAAHGHDLVASRQAAMKQLAAAVKTIGGMFAGKVQFDGTGMGKAATTVADHAGGRLAAWFPPGSLGPPSEASVAIDADRAAFEDYARRLEVLARTLDHKVRDAQALTPDMKMTGVMGGGSLLGGRAQPPPTDAPAEHVFHQLLETCTGCHAKFRQNAR